MIYYNRTQLERTGQQPPSNEWTTDQFLDTVKRATTGVGTRAGRAGATPSTGAGR